MVKKQGRSSPWVTTAIAAKHLGIHHKTLTRKIGTLFEQGVHYRVIDPTAYRPTYRWHLYRLEKLMERKAGQMAAEGDRDA